MHIAEVVRYLKYSGVVFDGSAVRVPTWSLYRTYLHYKKLVDIVALVELTFRSADRPAPLVITDKCPQCKSYKQYFCNRMGNHVTIPPGTFRKGCERFDQADIYF